MANYQLYKVEKENENLELKKKMSRVYGERPQRKETVWNRLSRPRGTQSPEYISQNRLRSNQIASKPSHRFQIMKQMAAQQKQQQQQQPQHQQMFEHRQLFYQEQQQPQEEHEEYNKSPRKPLTPPSAHNHKKGSYRYHMQKAIIMPEVDNQGFVYVCKPVKSVREIVTARSLRKSRSSSEHDYENQHSQRVLTKNEQPLPHSSINFNDDTSSTDSSEEFKLAPLMSSRTHYEIVKNSSTKLVGHFQQVLRNRKQDYLEPEELEIVKNVIKSDDRYTHLDESTPKLFQDILKTQLQHIMKQADAVKQALRKLDSSEFVPHNHSQSIQTNNQQNEIVLYKDTSTAPKKLEVDVVFRNVPSLEKEINILRALGERLDATLELSNLQRKQDMTTKTIPDERNEVPDVVYIEIKPLNYIYALEGLAYSYMSAKGIVRYSGVAQEFRIAQKTIVELKEESTRSFYIPTHPNSTELKKTSFRKLKENPDDLLRHLKAKSDTVAFNILDQDPVFFNNMFFGKKRRNANKSSSNKKKKQDYGKGNGKTQPTLCEGGDSCHFYQLKSTEEYPKSKTDTDVENKKSFVKTSGRKAKERTVTPIDMSKSISPKNNLLKTILVGSVQLSCFLLLVAAVTFPDAKCGNDK